MSNIKCIGSVGDGSKSWCMQKSRARSCKAWTNSARTPIKEFIAGAKLYPKSGAGAAAAAPLTVGGARVKADIYMKLFGPKSQTTVIDEDADSGYGLNPRISAQLLAGDYYVQLRHQERSGTGKYTIGVKKR